MPGSRPKSGSLPVQAIIRDRHALDQAGKFVDMRLNPQYIICADIGCFLRQQADGVFARSDR
jgi:hypothetical protein